MQKGDTQMVGEAIFVQNTMMPGHYNNYAIAGNICNAFALGEVGSVDDFFLIGAEPRDESPFPLLTGNILDSEGNVLFRLVRNQLVINPGHCSRILGDHIGYEIHDSAGKLIFQVRAEFTKLPTLDAECFITTISANFYDKNKNLVFEAQSGKSGEHIRANTKCVFGAAGQALGIIAGLSDEKATVARIALATGGTVHQLLTGTVTGEEVVLDGKILRDATLKDCTVIVRTGDFALLGATMDGCKIQFEGAASNVASMAQQLGSQRPN
jgi:hypothetical protein